MLGLTLVPAAPDSPLDTCLTVAGEHKLGAGDYVELLAEAPKPNASPVITTDPGGGAPAFAASWVAP